MQLPYCRICESSRLTPVLDLGTTALANRFLRPEQATQDEPRYPLRAVLCRDCGLLQLDEDVPPDELFADYIYVSGTSDGVAEHGERLARMLCRRYHVGSGDLVVEAGSNDGTVLRAFQWQGARVVGVEPAQNLAELARSQHLPTLVEFFDERVAAEIRAEHGPARMFLARHVLAHVAGLQSFVQGIKRLLAPDGVGVIEVPYLADLHARLEFDTIYHEHRCYFSLAVLRRLFSRFRLAVIDVERVPIHGGSLLVRIGHEDGPHSPTSRVEALLRHEERLRLAEAKTWRLFARRVAEVREEINAFVELQSRRGLRLAGYGAAAKGNTLLSYCGIAPDRLPYLVDKNPLKQGRLTPGTHIPVSGPERLLTDRPDVTLILAWNFADEIVAQQAPYVGRGGRFAVPLPTPQFVTCTEARAA